NATVTEVCPAFTRNWNTEGLIPEHFGANGRENGFSLPSFAVCAGEVRLAELYVFFIDFEFGRGIFLRFNFDHCLTFFDPPIVQCKEHRRDVFAGFRVEVHAKNRYPAVLDVKRQHLLVFPVNLDGFQLKLVRKRHLHGAPLIRGKDQRYQQDDQTHSYHVELENRNFPSYTAGTLTAPPNPEQSTHVVSPMACK